MESLDLKQTKSYIPPGLYHEKLPKRHIGAATVFTKNNKILLLNLTYKEYWGLPGGVIEANESPLEGLKRELKEELGITVEHDLPLRCINSSQTQYAYSLQLVFDGGEISDETISSIVLEDGEISELGFFAVEEAKEKLSPRLARRLTYFMEAKQNNTCTYFESSDL